MKSYETFGLLITKSISCQRFFFRRKNKFQAVETNRQITQKHYELFLFWCKHTLKNFSFFHNNNGRHLIYNSDFVYKLNRAPFRIRTAQNKNDHKNRTQQLMLFIKSLAITNLRETWNIFFLSNVEMYSENGLINIDLTKRIYVKSQYSLH